MPTASATQAKHHEESLRRDIERIRSKVLQMAGLCERAVMDCLEALQKRDRQLAYSVIIRDQRIDELEKEIDRLCLEFLVRQQPVAAPLRFVYSAIKINLELERVGDYAESMARQTLKLLAIDAPVPIERLLAIGELSVAMLRDATTAFVNQDAELARKTIAAEEAVDALKSKLNKDLVALFRENRLPFEALNPSMMITRRLERVSDQARNICMEVLYMCTGQYAKHPVAEVFRVLFVDEHNACRSQMAEAIAQALGQPKFAFASAGVDPRPVDPATISFMKTKGYDLSRAVPKALNQVPELDHYHVVVALSPEAHKAFPPHPRKMVFLDWPVPNPSAVQGPPEAVQAAFEQTYQFLMTHIRELVQAILGHDHG
jgi:phosphate transport system protein